MLKISIAGDLHNFNSHAEMKNSIFSEHSYIGPFYLNKEDAENHHVNISKLCFDRIKKCNLMFCWFKKGNELTAYGTFIEIGYALALGKTVVVCSDELLHIDVWFLTKSVHFIIRQNPVQGLKLALRLKFI